MNEKPFNGVELADILKICAVILGFSITLISLFSGQNVLINYLPIIFWLIILPFSIEGILATISNYVNKYHKFVNGFLIVCFISLIIALIIVFNYDFFTKLKFPIEWINLIGVLIFIMIIGGFGAISILSRKWEYDTHKKFSESFYNIFKEITKDGKFHTFLVVVSDLAFATTLFGFKGEHVQNYMTMGFRHYNIKNYFKGKIELSGEKILLVTNCQEKLEEIINKMEQNKNEVVGIIIDFKISEEQKQKLKGYRINELNR